MEERGAGGTWSRLRLPRWGQLVDLLFSNVGEDGRDADRSAYERFAIPYSFKPRLSVWEAFLAAVIAFVRIFSGSILFAFWGTYSLLALSKIHNSFWRFAAAPPLLLLFPLALGLLMFAISAFVRFIHRRPWRKIA
jgi:hypothetical protein